jgi:hypothetical protein
LNAAARQTVAMSSDTSPPGKASDADVARSVVSIAPHRQASATDSPHFLCQKVAEGVVICEDGGMTQQDKPAVVERVNVALIADSAAALGKLQARTGMKKVDIVNRAVQLYEFVEAQMREGNELVVRDENGIDRIVKIF